MTDYKDRLGIPLNGDKITFFNTNFGTTIAKGYERVVIGDRGPYIEFNEKQISKQALKVPQEERHRLDDEEGIFYYWEYRSKDESNVKVYFQQKTVSYADYKIGMYYISPFDILANGKVIIEKLNKEEKTDNQLLLFEE